MEWIYKYFYQYNSDKAWAANFSTGENWFFSGQNTLATARSKALQKCKGDCIIVLENERISDEAAGILAKALQKKNNPPPNIIITSHKSHKTYDVYSSKIIIKGVVTDDQKISRLRINSNDTKFMDNGFFEKEITLKNGTNDIFIDAIDNFDKYSFTYFTVNLVEKTDLTPPKITLFSDLSRGIRLLSKSSSQLNPVLIQGKVTDESGILEFFINGVVCELDFQGNFSQQIELNGSEDTVLLKATDKKGNKAEKILPIHRQKNESQQTIGVSSIEANQSQTGNSIQSSPIQFANKSDKMKTEDYYALVIGNNEYRYLPRLETAKKDARAIADVLKKSYGFKVELLLDASRKQTLNALNKMRKKLKVKDNFLLYYAGHGEFDKTANKAYWLPVDAERDNDSNWIIVDTLTSNMKRISSNHILVVADSCYSGTLTRRVITDLGSTEKRSRYLKKMLKRSSRTLLASGGNEPVYDNGGDGHSVFAQAFIDGLNEIEDKVFSAEQLFYDYIKEVVAGSAEQIPEYNTIRNSGHKGGDFVFRKMK